MGICGSVDGGDVKGGNESCVEIDEDRKKTRGWKSLKELKEYLRSEFEKKTKTWQRKEGQGYLHFAAYLGDVDATQMLIEDNAEVNAGDRRKKTALHLAAKKGHVDVAKVLIQNGADVNAVDKWKERTALHEASQYGHIDVAKLLLQNGACLLYTSPSPRDRQKTRMPSSA